MDIWKNVLTYFRLCYLALMINNGIQATNQLEKFPPEQSAVKRLSNAEVSSGALDTGQLAQGQTTSRWSPAARVPESLESPRKPDFVRIHAERNSAPYRLLSEQSTLYPFLEATLALDYFNKIDSRRKPKRRPRRVLLSGSAGGQNAGHEERRLIKTELTEEKVHTNDGNGDAVTQTATDYTDQTRNVSKHNWQNRNKSGKRKLNERRNKGTHFKSVNKKQTILTKDQNLNNNSQSSFPPAKLDESYLIQTTINKTQSAKRKDRNGKSGVGKSGRRKMRPGRFHSVKSRTMVVDLASSTFADNKIVLQSSKNPNLESSESPILQNSQSPVHQSNESPAHQNNESPAHKSNESPAHQSNESPAHQSSESSTHQSNESPAHQNNESPDHQNNESSAHQSNESSAHQSNESPRQIKQHRLTTLASEKYVLDSGTAKTTGIPSESYPRNLNQISTNRPDSMPHVHSKYQPNQERDHTSYKTSLGNSERRQPMKINVIESTTPLFEGDIRLEKLVPVSSAPRESTTVYKNVYDFLSNQTVIRRNQQQTRKFDAFNREFAERMCKIFGKRFVPTPIGGKCE